MYEYFCAFYQKSWPFYLNKSPEICFNPINSLVESVQTFFFLTLLGWVIACLLITVAKCTGTTVHTINNSIFLLLICWFVCVCSSQVSQEDLSQILNQ